MHCCWRGGAGRKGARRPGGRGRDRGCQRRRTGGRPGGRSCGDARILPQGCTKDSRRAVFNAWHMSAAVVKYVQCWCSVACNCTGMAVLRHIQAQPGMSTLAWSSHTADHSYHAWPAYCVRLSLRTLLFPVLVQVRYDYSKKRVVSEPLELTQEFR